MSQRVQRTQTGAKTPVSMPFSQCRQRRKYLTGEGWPGLAGDPPSNLYVTFYVKRHEFFQRQGNDVLIDLEINVSQTALGDEIMIQSRTAANDAAYSACTIRQSDSLEQYGHAASQGTDGAICWLWFQ